MMIFLLGIFYRGVVFKIDVNGIKGPNKLGEDIFLSQLKSNGKYQMLCWSNSRERVLKGCKSDGQCCGALIQQDGWQIKNDYPR